MMRRAATPVALVAAIALALLSAGAVLAHHTYQPFPGQATDGDDTLTGTSADEEWTGSEGHDTIRGEGGNDLIGRIEANYSTDFGATDDPGADTYYGGPGKDILDGRYDSSMDTINCGEGGADLASFDKGLATSPQTTVSDKVNTNTCERLDWTDQDLADCATKPWDNADVICKTGTNGPDTLLGKDVSDVRIVDAMWGEDGDDTLRGRRGFDGLEGGAGQDVLYGGPGDDTLYGNWQLGTPTGVAPEEKPDTVYGGDSDDRIDVSDARGVDPLPSYAQIPDIVSCGEGKHDWAVIDIGVDKDPQGVPIRESGQAGCESITEDQSFKSWWGPRKRHR
jgi:Ca2+-binding RTX toxin-like protein